MADNKQANFEKVRRAFGDEVADKLGNFQEAPGGGKPLGKGEKAPSKDWVRKNRKMQPRDNDVPEKAIISYERYLKDIEHDNAVMLGLISDEEDDAYEELREKEMEEESNWVKLEQEELSSMKLFGV